MSIRRAYKPVSTARHGQRRAVRWQGLVLLTSLAVSLIAGAMAYLRGTQSSVFSSAPQLPLRSISPPQPTPTPTPPAAAPVPPPPKPKYDFYTELPKRQVDIPPENTALGGRSNH